MAEKLRKAYGYPFFLFSFTVKHGKLRGILVVKE